MMGQQENRKNGSKRRHVYFIMAVLLVAFAADAFAAEEVSLIKPPETVGTWKRSGPTVIQPKGVFDYMDGAGELYLAYNMERLEAYRYTSADHGSILLEIYYTASADDAWGLLSGDWGGEAVSVSAGREEVPQTYGGRVPAARALYGAGLLRLAAGTVYARVLAERETAESRGAVLALGRAIAEHQVVQHPPPALVTRLPERLPGLQLIPERVMFFRTHLVLNSVYYLSSSNILALTNRCEAVSAVFRQQAPAEAEGGKPSIQFLIIRYPSPEEAEKALDSFLASYLPEVKRETPPREEGTLYSSSVEDGWVSVSRRQSYLAAAFRAASRDASEALVREALAGNLR